jgi:hypothetical protein
MGCRDRGGTNGLSSGVEGAPLCVLLLHWQHHDIQIDSIIVKFDKLAVKRFGSLLNPLTTAIVFLSVSSGPSSVDMGLFAVSTEPLHFFSFKQNSILTDTVLCTLLLDLR